MNPNGKIQKALHESFNIMFEAGFAPVSVFLPAGVFKELWEEGALIRDRHENIMIMTYIGPFGSILLLEEVPDKADSEA